MYFGSHGAYLVQQIVGILLQGVSEPGALALKNVFDKRYYLAADSDTAIYPGAPRFLQASLKYRF